LATIFVIALHKRLAVGFFSLMLGADSSATARQQKKSAMRSSLKVQINKRQTKESPVYGNTTSQRNLKLVRQR
jgi:hypothetical protein